ncbi:unnamed protein product [Effrenium voratum]|nr:unnamed protein product [Effrenium voratum]
MTRRPVPPAAGLAALAAFAATVDFAAPAGDIGAPRSEAPWAEADEGWEPPLFEEAQWWRAPEEWPEEARRLFVPLGPFDAATDFLCEAPPASKLAAALYEALGALPLNEFDLQALLYPGASHLLTARQLRQLLAFGGSRAPKSVLDVGAGDGCVTEQLRKLKAEVVALETSRGMAWRLRRLKNFEAHCGDLAAGALPGRSFELVCLLNVLDRCSQPQALLAAAREKAPLLLLATPLPFQASYFGPETSWTGEVPEPLGDSDAWPGDWAGDALRLLRAVLPQSGWRPLAVSRVPYLTGGDEEGAVELDDLVVLAERIVFSGADSG